MTDPVTIALSLAKYAPEVLKWLGKDDASKAAEKIVQVAQEVTGKSGTEAVESIGADPALLLKFKEQTAMISADLDKAYLGDVASARGRDVNFLTSGKHNIRADIMFVLAVVVTCFLVWIVWKDQDVNEYVKGIVTLVLGRFLGYLDNIYSFEFGSTRSSKSKDATIENLSR